MFSRTVPSAVRQQSKGIPQTSIGAFDGDELCYVFGTLDTAAGSLEGPAGGARWEKTARDLSAAMLRYWANFVRTGDPNGAGLPTWPEYEATANDPLMRFNDRPEVKPDERRARLESLDAALQSK